MLCSPSAKLITQMLCGPKFLRGQKVLCDGSCCGLGSNGRPDPKLTEKVNRDIDLGRNIKWLAHH